MRILLGASSVTQYVLNFDGALNIARSVAFWAIIVYVLSFIIASSAVKSDKGKLVLRRVFGVSASVLIAGVIATFLVFYVKEAKEYNLLPLLYAPLVVFCVCLISSVIAIILKPSKLVKIICASLLIASVVSVIICLSIYYKSGASLELNWIQASDVNTVGLWIGSIVISIIILLTAILTDKVKGLRFDVKSITYGGILGAMSLALSYVRVLKMPMGGSITLASTLPIMLYSYIFGTKKGVVLGVVMGLLQAVQDPWILHPAQFLLDYALAFGCLGLAGAFAKLPIKRNAVKFLIGGITCGILRFMCHFFAGAWAFGSFAPESYANEYVYSLAYNSAYVLPDSAISVVIGFILTLSKSFSKVINGATNTTKKSKSDSEGGLKDSASVNG